MMGSTFCHILRAFRAKLSSNVEDRVEFWRTAGSSSLKHLEASGDVTKQDYYQYPLKFRIFIGNRDFDLTFPNFNSGFSSFFHIALSKVKMT